MSQKWVTVKVPVEAKVISASITHHPVERYQEEGGEWGYRPERLAGVVKVMFRFGGKRIVTTKTIRFNHVWMTTLRYARDHTVGPSELSAARESVEDVLRDKMRDHGITVGDDLVIEYAEAES